MSEPDSWEFQEGEEVTPGRFALKLLGGGHHYEAYLSWDEHRLALVVVKLLRPHLVEDADARGALAREAEVLDKLAHPVIVRGFEAATEGPRPHLVMEHLEGPPLSSLIRRFGPLPLEQLLPLAVQVCSAVHYLAAEEMVHLDVKPRNIIMGAPPRLIDLSIARSLDRARRITGTVGTDAYMAPEQCDPEIAPIGPPADVWGLGASLYHAVTGTVPFPRDQDFDDSDPPARWPQLVEEPLPFPKRTPRSIVEPILGCLQKKPADRPTATEVIEALEPLVARLPDRPVLRRRRPGLR